MITAAAIKQNGCVYSGIPFKERHHDVIRQIVSVTKIKPVTGEQGFLDDNGNFLDRKKAAIHALSCGQIKELKYNSTELFSEDLW